MVGTLRIHESRRALGEEIRGDTIGACATPIFTRFEPSQFTDMADFLASHGRKDITVLMLSSRVISMVHLLEAHHA